MLSSLFHDCDCGKCALWSKGWELERPGGRYEFHAPKDYGGKRIIIKKDFLGKSKTLDLKLLGGLDDYAEVRLACLLLNYTYNGGRMVVLLK
eukprot:scaffold16771_cov32-Prasinocladus_malaysianus.AAC.1